ncbi:Major facilitator superfamily domain general substrate transporter, partial [Penicillium rubens]|uniref:Major facilitator superfamily domain general substrate transporter n=1 Tax=Penicillium rubens TaxID=1108849 RepID=UPI002A59CA37
GYCPPFLLAGSILATIGAGFVYTFDLASGLGPIIGYQILYGTGTGLSVQIPIVVVGALSSTDDQAITMATVLWILPIHIGRLRCRFHRFDLEQPTSEKISPNIRRIISAGSSGLEEVFSGSGLLGARRSYRQLCPNGLVGL